MKHMQVKRKDGYMENAAVLARREYQREWRKKNKQRVREYNLEYWKKRAEKRLREAAHDTYTK